MTTVDLKCDHLRSVQDAKTQACLSVTLHVKFLSSLTRHRNSVKHSLFYTRSNDDDNNCDGGGVGGNKLPVIN